MTSQNSQFIGFWRLTWMLLMQPALLRESMLARGVDPATSGLRLWKKGGEGRSFVHKIYLLLMLTSVSITIASMTLLKAFGFAISAQEALPRLGLGSLSGLLVITVFSPVWAFSTGAAVAAVFGAAGLTSIPGSSPDLPQAFAWSFYRGSAWGLTANLIFEVAPRLTNGPMQALSGRAISVSLGLYMIYEHIGTFGLDWRFGLTMGLSVFAGFLLVYLRIPLYAFESLVQLVLFKMESREQPWSIRFSPVTRHELSYFPQVFLAQHLRQVAKVNPQLTYEIFRSCVESPGQRRVAGKLLFDFQATELVDLLKGGRFKELIHLRGNWLPGTKDASPLLIGFTEVARYLASAAETSISYYRAGKLKRAQEELNAVRNKLIEAAYENPLSIILLTKTLPEWEDVINSRLHAAQENSAAYIPNPFRSKDPLSPEFGGEVFRGRKELIKNIEALLGDKGRGASIALLGPRRTGKTSLLKMLPVLLPDAVCIFFDLQDNPVDSTAGFFSALARRAKEQAHRDRNIEIPDLPSGSPFESAAKWIESLDSLPGNLRTLLCIDEFETLGSSFPGSHSELLRLMGLIRGTIQHRKRIRVLVAGAAPYGDFDDIWNKHLVNASELRIGFFDRETAYKLLREPIPEFPRDAIPGKVASAIYLRTGGQPNLVQLYGSLLVTRLNEQKRRQAKPEDLGWVEENVLSQEASYFRDTLRECPINARNALAALAHDQTPELDSSTRQWLRRRLLITEEGRLTMPVFGAWIRAEEG